MDDRMRASAEVAAHRLSASERSRRPQRRETTNAAAMIAFGPGLAIGRHAMSRPVHKRSQREREITRRLETCIRVLLETSAGSTAPAPKAPWPEVPAARWTPVAAIVAAEFPRRNGVCAQSPRPRA